MCTRINREVMSPPSAGLLRSNCNIEHLPATTCYFNSMFTCSSTLLTVQFLSNIKYSPVISIFQNPLGKEIADTFDNDCRFPDLPVPQRKSLIKPVVVIEGNHKSSKSTHSMSSDMLFV